MGRRPLSRSGRLGTTLGLAWMMFLGVAAHAIEDDAAESSGHEAAGFEVERTIAEVGRTRVIAITTEPGASWRPGLTVEPSDRVEVVLRPQVLDGRDIGYMRIRGLTPGEAKLTLENGATIIVDVVHPREQATDPDLAPRIIGPVSGAVVWDTFTVGVEVRESDVESLRDVRLILPGGKRLQPSSDTRREIRPIRMLTFDVDARRLPLGAFELVAEAIDSDGTAMRGPSITVQGTQPRSEDLIDAEAETRFDVRRPERFRDERVNVGRDGNASGKRFFLNASAYPAVCLPVTVEESGWYQVILTAGGTRAQGALPTVGIVVDGAQQSLTNVRLLRPDWHRVAAGLPIPLEAGEHVLTPFFANDFFAPSLADRNLHLDRIEVARVSPSGMSGGAGAMGSMNAMTDSMTGGASMTMSGGGMAMGMGMADPGSMSTGDPDPWASETSVLRLGFGRMLDGKTIPGAFEIDGRAWWTGVETRPAPMITLHINGTPVMSQRSGAPRFWVDASLFQPGENRIQMSAESGAARVATPVQTMHWPIDPDDLVDGVVRRDFHRFTIHDFGWEPAVRDMLVNRRYPRERVAAAFSSNREVGLTLPSTLSGRYDVFLEIFGEHFEGAPEMEVLLERADGTRDEIGTIEAPTWWDTRRVAGVELPGEADTRLIVRFTNDRFEAGVGDRNALLQSVMFVRPDGAPDVTPPTVHLDYPPADHTVWMADAVVVRVTDNDRVTHAELIIDGVESGVTLPVDMRPGSFVFPLLTRHLPAGGHTIAVRVRDPQGNIGQSESRSFTVLADAPTTPGRYHRAVHLLNRLGYGPDPAELGDVLTLGERAWLEDRLAAPADAPGELAAMQAGLPFFPNRSQFEVPARVISHSILTPNPVRARFVLWSQNHFSTWIRKVNGPRKWREHVRFSQAGVTTFDRLLTVSAESPAMLGYLDQDVSYAGRLNENYAREIMELHTLGVDGRYDQADVTNLAGLLTGWTAALEGDGRNGGQEAILYSFRFDPGLNDGRATEVIGMPFARAHESDRYDRVRLALETLAAHPDTARFVTRSLAEHYVDMPASDDLVDVLATVFQETGGDMRAVMIAMTEHPSFWTTPRAHRVMSPFDFAMRLCRTTSHYHPWQVGDFLRRSGFGLFDRPTPDGYPEEDIAFTDSNAMLQRWKLAQDAMWAMATLAPNGWRYGDRIAEPDWPQRIIDAVAVRLTGDVLSTQSNEAAVALLRETSGTRDERVRVIAPFIARLPEANLR